MIRKPRGLTVLSKPEVTEIARKPRRAPRESSDSLEIEVYHRKKSSGEIFWSPEVCMNPLRSLAFDCPGCQFYKPCVCYLKDNYKRPKKRVVEEAPPEPIPCPEVPKKPRDKKKKRRSKRA